jgi:hypothetical protein
MSKKARRPLSGRQPKPAPGSRAAAVGFFALLPIAVALGVVVGRSGSDGGETQALLQALRNQEAAASTASAGASATTGAASGRKNGGKQAKTAKTSGKPREKVVAKTANGTVHEVTGFHASQKKVEEDTKLVENNPEQTGENYIKAQQNLPDVIPVGGSGGSSGSSGSGAEP